MKSDASILDALTVICGVVLVALLFVLGYVVGAGSIEDEAEKEGVVYHLPKNPPKEDAESKVIVPSFSFHNHVYLGWGEVIPTPMPEELECEDVVTPTPTPVEEYTYRICPIYPTNPMLEDFEFDPKHYTPDTPGFSW